MAEAGSRMTASSPFYQALFSEANRRTPGFEEAVRAKYAKLAQLSSDPTYPVRVTCTPDCQGGHIAWAKPGTKQINICNPWFNDQTKVETSFILENCGGKGASSKKLERLSAFKGSKALTLLHEMAHLEYAGGKQDRARDYAYGVKDCLALAAGKHQNVKQCKGRCNPKESFENADTLALVAAGEYWSGRCGKKIALTKRDPCDQSAGKCRRGVLEDAAEVQSIHRNGHRFLTLSGARQDIVRVHEVQ
ncbi:MAG: hypothetical protein M1823_001221 [Watsoniomyces obsoletus]|nr:MAG: hypothetical protein M1823_001221 [Watsoniomyces obsoletus]